MTITFAITTFLYMNGVEYTPYHIQYT